MRNDRGEHGMIEIESRDDIPEFANEDEEVEFWATHSLGRKLAEHLRRVDASVSLPDRLRRVAESRTRT